MDESTEGVRVLVVDDDAGAVEAILSMLSLSGFEVRGAQNGAVGLEEVITFRPEVVVFDFWMPVADGRELLQGIREVARGRLGLVAMSGHPEVEDWCARVGVGQFLKKPFERAALVDAVARALEEARTASVRTRTSSAAPTARRLRVDRAVLLVGQGDDVRRVRSLLREGARPMQVAVVEEVEDAVRALSSFRLDAVALCGGACDDDRGAELVAAATARGLPVVIDRASASSPGVHLAAGSDADAIVAKIHEVVSGARSADAR